MQERRILSEYDETKKMLNKLRILNEIAVVNNEIGSEQPQQQQTQDNTSRQDATATQDPKSDFLVVNDVEVKLNSVDQTDLEITEDQKSAISNLAERNYRLAMTQRIFSAIAFFSFATSIASIFLAVSQIFYWIVTFVFSAIFVTSWLIARAAKRKNLDVLAMASKSRSNVFASVSNSLRYEDAQSSIAGIPVDTRAWEPNRLPAPRQRIGELELPTLAEVVEIEERVIKKSQVTLDSTALDEILRRRRANG